MKKQITDGGRRSGVRTESLENDNMAAKHTQPSGSAEHAHNCRHKPVNEARKTTLSRSWSRRKARTPPNTSNQPSMHM